MACIISDDTTARLPQQDQNRITTNDKSIPTEKGEAKEGLSLQRETIGIELAISTENTIELAISTENY